MAKPYYTSNTLIDAVKRKMAFPISQQTFSEQDILDFANEEMFLEQVPSIMQYHEEYFVFSKEVPLVSGQSSYPFPARAIGMKLRDVFFKTTAGQFCEMSRINADDRAFFQITSQTTPTPIYYYVQNNSIVIVPEISNGAVGTLIVTYYLRPNSLMPDDQAAVCTSFSKIVDIVNANLLPGDILSVGALNLIADTTYAIGAGETATATNISTYLNGLGLPGLTAAVQGLELRIDYTTRSMTITSSNTTALTVLDTTTVNTTTVPSSIVGNSLVDILQTDGGHNTLSYDVLLAPDAVSPTSITLLDSQLPTDFVVGDYICSQYQCIVPQVPTDLHNLLAERTCARILEALGDLQGLQSANTKIQRLEERQATIIDSRVEGAPMKVLNRSGLLRRNRTFAGRRRG